MSNLEHLMENALVAQQENLLGKKTFEESHNLFINAPINIDMAKIENISIESIWEMALYVTQTWNDFEIQDFMKQKYSK